MELLWKDVVFLELRLFLMILLLWVVTISREEIFHLIKKDIVPLLLESLLLVKRLLFAFLDTDLFDFWDGLFVFLTRLSVVARIMVERLVSVPLDWEWLFDFRERFEHSRAVLILLLFLRERGIVDCQGRFRNNLDSMPSADSYSDSRSLWFFKVSVVYFLLYGFFSSWRKIIILEF